MTTKLTLHVDQCSNGDVHYKLFSTYRDGDGDEMVTREVQPEVVLTPGMKSELCLTTSHKVEITETWPTVKPASDALKQGAIADTLIASEVTTQDKMWGDANERADSMKGQLLDAAAAQVDAIRTAMHEPYLKREIAFEQARDGYYPRDWSGFRDYGSDIANLVVAAAYLRNEIKRRLLKGESYHRAPRQQPYTGDQPAVSSAEASSHTVGRSHTGTLASPA